ncbi:MAG: hypothetical protein KJO69_04830, partial [Gammaproteobacteria bacterium]|nr:hypothetical protein [Gammaproteobacteria bacterium]
MERDDSEREGFVKVYGMWVPDSVSALELEMFHYYHSDEEWEWGSEGERLMVVGDCEKGVAGMSVDERRGLDHKLPRVEHFYNIVEMLVNRGEKVVERNRWLDEMVEGMISYDWCTLAGSGSSGKSFAAALVSVIDFICDPHESLCLITSTSIKGAQLRVWASVSRIWNRIPNRDDYGVMQMTDCRIRGFD